MSGSNARGQAVVETALSLLVFVTILIFGIHFAEVGYLSLKTSEAASSALWDATGMRAHRFRTTGGTFTPTFYNSDQMKTGFPAKNTEERANRSYRDFDGRESTASGARLLTQVFTRASGLSVSCRPEALAVFRRLPRSPSDIILEVYPQATARGRRVDGMSCNADSMLEGWKLPRRFFEKTGGGYFKARHYRNVGIKVCAFGRPRGVGGDCAGRVNIALGDWGFAGRERGNGAGEWSEVKPFDPSFTNMPYYRAVERLYQRNGAGGGNAATNLASLVTGAGSPANENAFNMVFRGEYNGFTPALHHELGSESGTYDWAVSPATGPYDTALNTRSQCFLGMPCSGFL